VLPFKKYLNNFFNIKILIYFKIKNILKKYKTPSYASGGFQNKENQTQVRYGSIKIIIRGFYFSGYLLVI